VVVAAPPTPRTEPSQAPRVDKPQAQVVAAGGGSSTGQDPTGEARVPRHAVASPQKDEHKPEPARAVVTEVREARPQESRKAMVRFVVKPITVWAEVSCNGTKMGETPFRDVQMTVGTYDCKFSNPDQGTRTRRVEVKPSVPNIVVVQF
jgi:serine/threonine-protein kinase